MRALRRLRLTVLTALAPLVLGACALGPDYVRPTLDTPAAHRFQADAATAQSVADPGWWAVYGDARLQTLIGEAVQRNLDLRAAAARVEQARAVLGSSRIGQLPQVGISGGVEREQLSLDAAGGGDRTRTTESLGLNLSWELDLWGRLRRQSEAARAEVLAAEYARRGVLIGVVGDVASAWFRLASLGEQLRVTRATVETREQFLSLTRAQFERGVVSGLDVSQAEAQLATARASIPEFERQVAQTEHALSLLLGRNPGEIAAGEELALPPVDVPAGLPSELLQRRPDVQQAEQVLVAANARIGAARAALFPTLSLTAGLGSVAGPMRDLLTGPSETWSVGVGLLQPLLDAERNLYRVDLADARKAEALALYERTLRNAFREVSDSLVSRQKYREVERAQADLVAALRRSEEIATARYKVGYSSYFDVINADRDYFNAKLALASARLNTQLATVQLYRALGGGWETQPAP